VKTHVLNPKSITYG